MPFRHAARHHFKAGDGREAHVHAIAPAGIDRLLQRQQMLMLIAGEKDFANAFRVQLARLVELVVKHRLFEEAHLFRTVAVHIPLIFTIDVGHNRRIVTHHLKQVGGDIAVEVVGEDLLPFAIVHASAVRGDHIGFNAEIIANLPNIDVVAAGREHEVDTASGKQLQRLFGVGS